MTKLFVSALFPEFVFLQFPSLLNPAHWISRLALPIRTLSYTVSTFAPQQAGKKSSLKSGKPEQNSTRVTLHFSAVQCLGQLVQEPVQILVRLALLLNLIHRVHDGGVMLAAELAPDFR